MRINDPLAGKTVVKGKREENVKKAVVSLTLDAAFDLFYSAKKAEGTRDRTRADYVRHWRYFCDWLSTTYPHAKINDVTATAIRSYVNYMSTKTKYENVLNRELESGKFLEGTHQTLRANE
ncbi:hypothetical protein ACFFSY_32930 [Paenibacillus aurantiacus]|uniref:Core-binding (CB) domain-containing protein n=1 Tax=Paenibacillus aurantiacus TaxID=1936118 RepID=A0ABV5L006_9BACL